eukprot:gnl/MRDRNA2_/MRDRNA2_51963_c0_seq1.p1 gnl/MRDRNA2_/MRDRNA2_51963_c0~~gnl/MRDRNA2_/MRDRNA2_51963_c0_seq1.p1  ORF type:complete len:101 (+),score=9.20 gnl/MRDRNA2_/MRDRNA2_51963_c0_seq1:94-396(+)
MRHGRLHNHVTFFFKHVQNDAFSAIVCLTVTSIEQSSKKMFRCNAHVRIPPICMKKASDNNKNSVHQLSAKKCAVKNNKTASNKRTSLEVRMSDCALVQP